MPVDESELRAGVLAWREEAKAWFAQHGREVAIVIPSYRDSHLLEALFAGLTSTTPTGSYRVIVSDDASRDALHTAYLDRIEREFSFVTVLRSATNGGFAVNVNRALRALPDHIDVVLMNSDVVPLDGWLAALQYSLHVEPADIIAPKMLFPDGSIQFCGGTTSMPGTRSFAHRYRDRPEYFPPATIRMPALYATGAVLYVPAATRARLGVLDEQFVWGHDDVDYSIRCWQTGGEVAIEPRSVVVHQESMTVGKTQGDPRIAPSAAHFWNKHGAFFRRSVADRTGRTRVIFVTDNLGHNTPFHPIVAQLDFLMKAGFDCELWNVGGPPHLIDRSIPVRGFPTLADLEAALTVEDALKVCCAHGVAGGVWRASLLRGLPVFWARSAPAGRTVADDAQIQASYRSEYTIITDDLPVAQSVFGAGFDWPVVAPDHSTFAAILDRLALSPVYGDGRVVKL